MDQRELKSLAIMAKALIYLRVTSVRRAEDRSSNPLENANAIQGVLPV